MVEPVEQPSLDLVGQPRPRTRSRRCLASTISTRLVFLMLSSIISPIQAGSIEPAQINDIDIGVDAVCGFDHSLDHR